MAEELGLSGSGLPQQSLHRYSWNGRGLGWSQAQNYEGCICNRPHHVVLCGFCGFYCRGRLDIQCKVHINVIFLMDIKQCPKCKAYKHMLSEISIADVENGSVLQNSADSATKSSGNNNQLTGKQSKWNC